MKTAHLFDNNTPVCDYNTPVWWWHTCLMTAHLSVITAHLSPCLTGCINWLSHHRASGAACGDDDDWTLLMRVMPVYSNSVQNSRQIILDHVMIADMLSFWLLHSGTVSLLSRHSSDSSWHSATRWCHGLTKYACLFLLCLCVAYY